MFWTHVLLTATVCAEIAFGLALALLCYTLVVYPALMAVAGLVELGRRRRDDSVTGILPRVALIIPAHDEEEVLEQKLENAKAIDYPADQLEIVVGDDASTDRTVEIAHGFESRGVRVLEFKERRGKASVLNDAVKATSGEVLCLCDANVMFRPDALRRLVGRLSDPRVGAVSGDVRLASKESNFGVGEALFYRLERATQLGESRIGSMIGVDGGMYAVRRELFRPLPPDTILDDFVTTMRVIRQGRRVVYEPEAVATENGTPFARQESRRRVRVTAGAVQSIFRRELPSLWQPVEFWQYVSHRLLRWGSPIWLAVLLGSSVILSNNRMMYRVALAAQLLLYTLAVFGVFSLRFRRSRLGRVTFYFVMSHAAMAVGLVKGLLNLQPVAWDRPERTTAHGEATTQPATDAGKGLHRRPRIPSHRHRNV